MDWTRIVEACIVILPQVLAIYFQYRNAKKLDNVHELVNGQSTAINKFERAAGKLEGIAEQKAKEE